MAIQMPPTSLSIHTKLLLSSTRCKIAHLTIEIQYLSNIHISLIAHSVQASIQCYISQLCGGGGEIVLVPNAHTHGAAPSEYNKKIMYVY